MAYQFDEHQHIGSGLDIARGYYNNVTPVNLFGFNRTIATSYETVMNDGGGIYAFPSSAVTMSVVSSASDTCSVQLIGLDANWLPISETVTLTGTTPVNTTQAFLRINFAIVTVGTQSGNVTVSNGGTTYKYIEAGTGMSQAAVYSTAAGEKLYINAVSFTSGTVNPNKYLMGRVYKKSYGAAIDRFWQATWATSQLSFQMPVPFVVPEKTDFAIEAASSSSENEISVYINAHSISGE